MNQIIEVYDYPFANADWTVFESATKAEDPRSTGESNSTDGQPGAGSVPGWIHPGENNGSDIKRAFGAPKPKSE